VTALGRAELADDPLFCTNALRLKNRELLEPEIASAFTCETLESWTRVLTQAGVLFAPVRDFDEVFSDPVVRDGMVQTIDHPTVGQLPVLRNPIKLSNNCLDIRRPPPLLGQHTDEVLKELQAQRASDLPSQ
jgi:crotonobetainyl-CoA:carnitine CoA-transferase CaiB-like acyl-CoA transferase